MMRLLALLALSTLSVVAAPSPTLTIHLEPYFRDLRLVHLKNGSRVLTMLVDTGAGATAISPGVATASGCTPHGQDIGHRMNGDAVTFQRCEPLTLGVNGWTHTFTPIGVFEVGALLPKELPHLDGILALDAFRGSVLTIDWKVCTVVIVGSSRQQQAIAASGMPMRPATGDAGRLLTAFVPARGTHENLWFLLDSGNLRGTLVSDSVLSEGLLPLDATGRGLLAIGSRPVAAMPLTSERLVIDGALGTDFLLRGPLTLDLRAL
jgi:hypothetical protein